MTLKKFFEKAKIHNTTNICICDGRFYREGTSIYFKGKFCELKYSYLMTFYNGYINNIYIHDDYLIIEI